MNLSRESKRALLDASCAEIKFVCDGTFKNCFVVSVTSFDSMWITQRSGELFYFTTRAEAESFLIHHGITDIN